MVKELEISDWDPFEIANMIDREISTLLPHRCTDNSSDTFHSFSYQDDCGDEQPHHHFNSFSSASSLQEFIPDLVSKFEELSSRCYWPHGMSSLFITSYCK